MEHRPSRWGACGGGLWGACFSYIETQVSHLKVSRPSLWVILGSFFGAHGRIFLHDKARFFACGSCSR